MACKKQVCLAAQTETRTVPLVAAPCGLFPEMGGGGIEPPTPGFSIPPRPCGQPSANWPDVTFTTWCRCLVSSLSWSCPRQRLKSSSARNCGCRRHRIIDPVLYVVRAYMGARGVAPHITGRRPATWNSETAPTAAPVLRFACDC
jgi:hypothetical protein